VYVARKEDAKQAPQAAHARVIIDDSLIGGWRMVNGNTLIDASYKKQLLDMYRGATRS
jgi:F0F1-type ATP synthase delta subunit